MYAYARGSFDLDHSGMMIFARIIYVLVAGLDPGTVA